jgi:hypothetical protein
MSLSFLLAFSYHKMNTGEVVGFEPDGIKVSFMIVGEPAAYYSANVHLEVMLNWHVVDTGVGKS